MLNAEVTSNFAELDWFTIFKPDLFMSAVKSQWCDDNDTIQPLIAGEPNALWGKIDRNRACACIS